MWTFKYRIRPTNDQVKKLWEHSRKLNWVHNQLINGPNHMKYYDSQIAKLQLKMDARYPLTKGEDNKNHISRNRRHLNDVIRKLCRVKRTKTNDILHKISTDLSRRYDTVYMEDLKLKKMSETKATGRNREIRNKCIGRFCDMLKYKVNHLHVVNPMYTSQTCAYCGHKHEKRLPLYRRTFICDECGLVIGRDYNAALNILYLGRASRSGLYKDNVSIVDIHPYMWWDDDTRKCLEQAIDANRYSGLHREAPSFRGE